MPAAKGFNMIYYVEDDDNIRDLTVYALRKQGIEAEGFSCDGEFKAAVARPGTRCRPARHHAARYRWAWRLCVDCVPIA